MSPLIFEDKDSNQPYDDRAELVQKKNEWDETYLVDRRYSLTVVVRFDCPTVTIPEYKKCTVHITSILLRGITDN